MIDPRFKKAPRAVQLLALIVGTTIFPAMAIWLVFREIGKALPWAWLEVRIEAASVAEYWRAYRALR